MKLNPVNAGMVKEAMDYPWSSARFHLGVSQGDALVKDRTLLGLVQNWSEYLNVRDEPSTQTRLLRGLRTGRPTGSDQFVNLIEKITGRDLRMRQAGRPLNRAS